jgi:hypothetical protein
MLNTTTDNDSATNKNLALLHNSNCPDHIEYSQKTLLVYPKPLKSKKKGPTEF